MPKSPIRDAYDSGRDVVGKINGRARCLAAILNWSGLSEDEKRIATMAIMADADGENVPQKKEE